MIWSALGTVLLIVIAAPFLAEGRRRPVSARARAEAPGEIAALPGGRTYFEWHGPPRGPVVVCIHGLTTPSYVWGPLAEGLAAEGFRVLTYDLYGRGLSDRVPGVQNSAFFLRQLSELLADQQVTGHFALIGYSMGGAIATAYAARSPAQVDRMVLLAPAGLGHRLSGFFEAVQRLPVLGDGLAWVFGGLAHRAGIEAPVPDNPAARTIARRQKAEMGTRGTLPAVLSSQRHILSESREEDHRQLGRTGLPVLAIWGEEDAIIPLAALGRMTQMNRGTRHATLPGAGHDLPYTRVPEVLAAMDAFLSGQLD